MPWCFMIRTALRIGARGLRSSWPSMARNSFLRASAWANSRTWASLRRRSSSSRRRLTTTTVSASALGLGRAGWASGLGRAGIDNAIAPDWRRLSVAAQQATAASSGAAAMRPAGATAMTWTSCKSPQTTRIAPSTQTLPRAKDAATECRHRIRDSAATAARIRQASPSIRSDAGCTVREIISPTLPSQAGPASTPLKTGT